MWWALSTSDYYGSSVAIWNIQSLTDIAFRHFHLGNPCLTMLIGK